MSKQSNKSLHIRSDRKQGSAFPTWTTANRLSWTASRESKRGCRHAIDEFIQWYCSEPRLSFSKVVVTRYRIFLENRDLAAGTTNSFGAQAGCRPLKSGLPTVRQGAAHRSAMLVLPGAVSAACLQSR
jgi:hypothetical protein